MRKQIVILILCGLMLSLSMASISRIQAKESSSSSESATLAATATVFSEGFEGAFPGTSWNVGDDSATNGLDYWDDTNYKAHSGSWSGWCAQYGTHTTTTIFTENFEGAFPSAWQVSDANHDSGDDYWGDTNYRAHSGSWSGWCAQVGVNSAVSPYTSYNSALHLYDDNMTCVMYRRVGSLTGYTSVTLKYWYWLYCEPNYDFLTVMYWDGTTWIYPDLHTGYYGYWQYSTVSIPTYATWVGFKFTSDRSVIYEGAYVDDVELTASGNVYNTADHHYDNYMDSVMYRRVSLGSFASVTLTYWYWLYCETNYDYLQVMYWDGTTWSYLDSHTGQYGYWISSTVSIPKTATFVGFRFHSDSSINFEGAYLDDIVCTGTLYAVHLESKQDTGSTSNRGTVTFAGTTYNLPIDIAKTAGKYLVRYNAISGYEFKSWQTSGGISVASATANPTNATVAGSGTLRAIYRRVFFADGFESGSFGAWNGTGVTSGETTTVTNALHYSGTFSALFTSNGGGGTERAYCYKTITSQPQLYARGYFRVATSGIVQNDDRFYLIVLKAGSNEVAWAGWRKTGGVVKWFLQIRNGTSYTSKYSTSTPSTGVWYNVEIRWVNNAVSGLGQLWVNGVLVCSITGKNTATYGNVNRLDFGLPQVINCATTKAYLDSVKVANTYI